mmetsp:Transcript_23635/g.69017  ORF Transcript_23635/g.69017 Transcript_23635/m.69017 type:complete len:141 (-) Transcript_23635:740-1162(-)
MSSTILMRVTRSHVIESHTTRSLASLSLSNTPLTDILYPRDETYNPDGEKAGALLYAERVLRFCINVLLNLAEDFDVVVPIRDCARKVESAGCFSRTLMKTWPRHHRTERLEGVEGDDMVCDGLESLGQTERSRLDVKKR